MKTGFVGKRAGLQRYIATPPGTLAAVSVAAAGLLAGCTGAVTHDTSTLDGKKSNAPASDNPGNLTKSSCNSERAVFADQLTAAVQAQVQLPADFNGGLLPNAAVLQIRLTPDGAIGERKVLVSSHDPALDALALKALAQVDPAALVALPAHSGFGREPIMIPLEFLRPNAIPSQCGLEKQPAESPCRGKSADRESMEALAQQIIGRLQRNAQYPRNEWLCQHEGRVLTRFVVDQKGHLLAHWVQKTSGHSQLDAAALVAVERAAPYPSSFPAPLSGLQRIYFEVPIAF